MGSNSIQTTGLNFVPLHRQEETSEKSGNSSLTQVAAKGVSNYAQTLKNDLNDIKEKALKFTMTQSVRLTLTHQPSLKAKMSQKIADSVNSLASLPGLSRLKNTKAAEGSHFIQLERKQQETLNKLANFLQTKSPTEQQVKDLSDSLKNLEQNINSYMKERNIGLGPFNPRRPDTAIAPMYQKLDAMLGQMQAKQEVKNLPNLLQLSVQATDPQSINSADTNAVKVKEMFDQMLIENHAYENREFQEAAIEFSKHPTAAAAQRIVDKFMNDQAQVANLSSELISEIKTKIAEGNIDADLFKSAYVEIKESLVDYTTGKFTKWLDQPFDFGSLLA